MLPQLWRFIKDRKNREVVSWVGGGATVIIAGIWGVFVFFYHQDDKKPGASTTTNISQSAPGIAPGRDTHINAPVTIGLDEKKAAEKIAEAQKPLAERLEKLAAQVAREKGVEIVPLRAILIKLGEVGIPDEGIAKRLDEKADELVKLRQEIARLRQGPAELSSFAVRAQKLIANGDFDGARAALAEGRAKASKLREQSSHYEAEFLAQEAKVNHIQLRYREAAAKYAEAGNLVANIDRQKQLDFMLAQARELYAQGNEFGDNQALLESIVLYRSCLSIIDRSERTWATTQNSLGNALQTLGWRESGTAKLEEAVAAYRAALLEWTRERVPLDWAMTQNNLGAALWALGGRESGTAKLEEAVAAYRAALLERTRERVPLDWAGTQNNLGTALRALGERESGTKRLEQAAETYRTALKVYEMANSTYYVETARRNLARTEALLAERRPR